MQELSIMARPSFVKPSVLVLTILCLSQLLAGTEAMTYHAKVRVVNKSGRDIQANSTYITNKFTDVSSTRLKFPKAIGNGKEDDADGTQIVDYDLVGRINRWFVTWVFADTKSIEISDPSSLPCFDNQMNLLGPHIISEVETKERGATICGLPPTCSQPPPNAAAGAAVATDFISTKLFNQNEILCGFQPFELTLHDSIAYFPDNWVTITIQPKGVLQFQSATSSTDEIGYVRAKITAHGVVTLEPSDSRTPRAAGSFGVEIPAISSVA
jgi:hypothetical protein